MNIPVVSFIGFSGSGKTTFLEKLIPVLKSRGIRLALLKHDAHRFEMDKEGKDTWRFANAGADVVAIASGEKAAILEQRPLDMDEMIDRIRDVDLIITEGYKLGDKPRIEIHRVATGKPMFEKPENLMAIITDAELATDTPCFGLEDVEAVANLVVDRFLK